MTNQERGDCGAEMERGSIPDISQTIARQAGWYRGEPEPHLFLGFKTSAFKVDHKKFVPITAYRCSGCGLLKFYANVPEEK